jgi:hypothetical protein
LAVIGAFANQRANMAAPSRKTGPGRRVKRAAGESITEDGIVPTARELTGQALQVLAKGLSDTDIRIRLACAKEVIGHGKALAMTSDLSQRLDGLDDETLDAAIDAIRQALGAAGDAAGGAAAEAAPQPAAPLPAVPEAG